MNKLKIFQGNVKNLGHLVALRLYLVQADSIKVGLGIAGLVILEDFEQGINFLDLPVSILPNGILVAFQLILKFPNPGKVLFPILRMQIFGLCQQLCQLWTFRFGLFEIFVILSRKHVLELLLLGHGQKNIINFEKRWKRIAFGFKKN